MSFVSKIKATFRVLSKYSGSDYSQADLLTAVKVASKFVRENLPVDVPFVVKIHKCTNNDWVTEADRSAEKPSFG